MKQPSEKKKKKKRQPKKYKDLALYGRGKVGTKRWKIDYDYLNELNSKEKDFLNSFTEEYYLGNFPKDKKTGKYKAKLLKSTKSRRKSWNENNVSNRDIMSLNNVKVKGKLVVTVVSNNQNKLNELIDMQQELVNTEDLLVEKLDAEVTITNAEALARLKRYRQE